LSRDRIKIEKEFIKNFYKLSLTQSISVKSNGPKLFVSKINACN